MSAAEIVRAERTALCDQFEALGPDAPTLCEGWTTADLAAHLVVREHRPDAMPGIIVGGRFAAHTTQLMERAKAKGYESLIETLRTKAPLLFRVGPGAWGNLIELFVHHEDVRRANGHDPRPADPDLDAALWKMLGLSSRLALTKVKKFGLELDAGDGRERVVRNAEPRVVLRGAPGELVLYLSGRKDAAHVELIGPEEARRAVMAADFGT